jgi:hypothetical protein
LPVSSALSTHCPSSFAACASTARNSASSEVSISNSSIISANSPDPSALRLRIIRPVSAPATPLNLSSSALLSARAFSIIVSLSHVRVSRANRFRLSATPIFNAASRIFSVSSETRFLKTGFFFHSLRVVWSISTAAAIALCVFSPCATSKAASERGDVHHSSAICVILRGFAGKLR